jgi:hypothetical protein
MSPLPASEHELSALTAEIETFAIQQAAFTHARHLLLALDYVRRFGREGALERMRATLQAFNGIHKPTFGYHETITGAWIALVWWRASSGREASRRPSTCRRRRSSSASRTSTPSGSSIRSRTCSRPRPATRFWSPISSRCPY